MDEAAQMAPMMEDLLARFGALGRAFYERYGKEALPLIAEVMSKGGVESAQVMLKMMPVKGMKDAGQLFVKMGGAMDTGMEIIELTDDTFHFKLSRCLFCLDGAGQDLCEAMMASDAKMMSTILGQGLKMDIVKSVAAGDGMCEVIFSKK
ncbi:MAG: L-2-amino-thiazoline-4-carboxylic acid hydrolase [Dehalococcoidia bacterium]|jgi:predicted hydrocarbon binding protein